MNKQLFISLTVYMSTVSMLKPPVQLVFCVVETIFFGWYFVCVCVHGEYPQPA